ncbi:hypothetical protein SNEBB_004195 [Seison nebaliae]|nr:hypothetical protein SNEBB_004195 [Seison nebaliae]
MIMNKEEDDSKELSNSNQICFCCNSPILDKWVMNVGDETWHEQCLRCTKCNELCSWKCFNKNGLIFCPNDYFEIFQNNSRNLKEYRSGEEDRFLNLSCTICEKIFFPSSTVIQTNNRLFHHECFRCSQCGMQLRKGDEFGVMSTDRSVKILCSQHYFLQTDDASLSPLETMNRNSSSFTDWSSENLSDVPHTKLEDGEKENKYNNVEKRKICSSHECSSPKNAKIDEKNENKKEPLTEMEENNNLSMKNFVNGNFSNDPFPSSAPFLPQILSNEQENSGTFQPDINNDGSVDPNHLPFLMASITSNNGNNNPQGLPSFLASLGAPNQGLPPASLFSHMNAQHPASHLHQSLLHSVTTGNTLLGNHHTHMSNARQKRMRTSFKHHQLRIMKTYFQLNHNPDAKDLKQLSTKTGLSKRVLQVWFQNARAKYRRGVMAQEDNGKDVNKTSENGCSNNEEDIEKNDEDNCEEQEIYEEEDEDESSRNQEDDRKTGNKRRKIKNKKCLKKSKTDTDNHQTNHFDESDDDLINESESKQLNELNYLNEMINNESHCPTNPSTDSNIYNNFSATTLSNSVMIPSSSSSITTLTTSTITPSIPISIMNNNFQNFPTITSDGISSHEFIPNHLVLSSSSISAISTLTPSITPPVFDGNNYPIRSNSQQLLPETTTDVFTQMRNASGNYLEQFHFNLPIDENKFHPNSFSQSNVDQFKPVSKTTIDDNNSSTIFSRTMLQQIM